MHSDSRHGETILCVEVGGKGGEKSSITRERYLAAQRCWDMA